MNILEFAISVKRNDHFFYSFPFYYSVVIVKANEKSIIIVYDKVNDIQKMPFLLELRTAKLKKVGSINR